MAMEGLKLEEEDQNQIDPDIKDAYKEIRRKKHVFREEHSMKRYKTAYKKNKDINQIK